MKIAITGHSAGIGLALAQIYQEQGHEIIGLSRRNGYNIRSVPKVADQIEPCDVFINNAPAGFSQTLLFLELFQEWKNNSNKTIINVGSRIAEIKSLPYNRQDLLQYQAEKLILKEMTSRTVGFCKVKYKWFAYVGTEKILKKYPHFTEADYISEEQAVDIILS